MDNSLEAEYIDYIKRKQRQGKPPKRSCRRYPFWEVYLDNGKYLDGYNPVTKEVVSRKATDLVDISESTFISHLDELLEKYAPPRVIKSKKPGYEELFNKPLPSNSKLILEIPESNKTFYDIERYEQIAADKGITIKYMAE